MHLLCILEALPVPPACLEQTVERVPGVETSPPPGAEHEVDVDRRQPIEQLDRFFRAAGGGRQNRGR
jgi:hypothetical protein